MYQGYFGNEWYLKQFGRKNRSAIALNKLLNLHLGSTRKPEHDIEYTYLKKKIGTEHIQNVLRMWNYS